MKSFFGLSWSHIMMGAVKEVPEGLHYVDKTGLRLLFTTTLCSLLSFSISQCLKKAGHTVQPRKKGGGKKSQNMSVIYTDNFKIVI